MGGNERPGAVCNGSMRRYRKQAEIREIEVDGTTVRVRRGRDGQLGDDEFRSFQGPSSAFWEADRLGASWEAEGFELVERDDEAGLLSHEAFEQALREDPDNLDSYLVYGDWLQSRGDPRGELIATQFAVMNESDPVRRQQLERQATALYFRHRRHLWGELGEMVVSTAHQLYANDMFRADWHLGFIRTARFEPDELDLDLGDLSFGEVMRIFLALDSAQLLRDMRIRAKPSQEHETPEERADEVAALGAVVAAVADHAPATLQALLIGELDDRWNHLPALALPCDGPRLRGLRRLHVCVEDLQLKGPLPAGLERISFDVARNASRLAEILAEVPRPALTSLALRILQEEARYEGVRFDASALQPILRGSGAPRLTSLAVRGTLGTDLLCREIAAGSLAGRLEHLDLAFGDLGASGVDALVTGGFDSLHTLVVQYNRLSEDDIARLGDRFPVVRALPQEPAASDPDASAVPG